MASSSSSTHSASVSSSQSCKYDVFLSFRGEDIRKTFVDNFYSALVDRHIRTFKDDEELHQGDTIRSSLSKAIKDSRIAIVILSENYADSSWCLEELAYIMKCRDKRGLIVEPIFYDVEPSEVRNQKSKFGEAFAKQEAKYDNKAKVWRKVLVEVSNIVGWELKNIANGHESKAIKEIVNKIQIRLFSDVDKDLVDEDLVGIRARLQYLESQLDIKSSGVRMVGIWGVGGSGKTTLATSIYMEISHQFQGHCIVENVREESSKHDLKTLQQNILSALSENEVKIRSVVEGKHKLRSMLCHRKVLVLLDDVDKLDQLEALVGKHNWFGSGSRIIITTRDEHLLITHKVDKVCPIKLLSREEAVQLFKRHAFNEKVHVEDYETLSLRVVSYAGGLPLALKVLGKFLHDKKEWMSTFARLKDIPETEIVEKLKISYDGLKTVEKELFLDIACFFKGWNIDEPMEILEACEFHPKIGIEVLRQKALISIVDDKFDMHDLIQEMGQYIVRGEHPNNPEKHSRVWKKEEIVNLCLGDATKENDKIEAIRYNGSSSGLCKAVSNMKKLRWLKVTSHYDDEGPILLSNELRYIHWRKYPTRSPLLDRSEPMKLVVLVLEDNFKNQIWKGFKHLPHLKVLQLKYMKKLINTPNFDGLPRLQKLTISNCYKLKEIHPSLGTHANLEYVSVSSCHKLRIFPTFIKMENLKTLEIKDCYLKDGEIPFGIGELSNLQELNLSNNKFSQLNFSISQLTRLKLLNLSECTKLLELPELPSSLAILIANSCNSLTIVVDCHKCKWLCQVSFMRGSMKNDENGLLQSMLEGNAIENGSILFLLEGVEVAKAFTPPLVRGSRCRLQLPEKWSNDFSGFLMCATFFTYDYKLWYNALKITLEQKNDVDLQHDVAWEDNDSQDEMDFGESGNDSDSDSNGDSQYYLAFEESGILDGYKHTWVGYVSFDSLRHTEWWDETYNALSFSFDDIYKICRGFGVRLVNKKSRSGQTETSAHSSYYYAPEIKIKHDSESVLKISLNFYDK